MKKRILCLAMTLIMIFALLPLGAFAASGRLPAPAATITNNTATGKIKLSWDEVKNAKYYSIYRATSKDGTYSKIKTTTVTTYTDTTATIGKTYYYRVKANASDSSLNSTYKSTLGRTCKCARPTLSVSVSNGNPRLTWDEIEGASYYSIYRATSKDGTYSKIKTTKVLKFIDTDTKVGQTYYYKIKANNENSTANSAYSTIKSAKVNIRLNTTSITTCDGTTKTLKATVSPSTAKVTWSSSNTSVATVTSAGKVKAVDKGTATITAKITTGGKTYKATCKITVKDRVEAFYLFTEDGDAYIEFDNNTGKEVNRIEFNVTQYDSNGKKLTSPYDGYYSSDTVPAHNYLVGSVPVNTSTASATVKITKVKFSDGTTWAP